VLVGEALAWRCCVSHVLQNCTSIVVAITP
jgi:hypothetical protein